MSFFVIVLLISGDSLSHHNGMKFSTYDVDNDLGDINCAIEYQAGMWYRGCHKLLLTGEYHTEPACLYGKGVVWSTFRGQEQSLKFSEMKLRKI